MLAALGRKGAGLDVEFLHGVREGKREGKIVGRIVVVAAIKLVESAVGEAASNRDRNLAGVCLGGNQIGIGSLRSGAGEVNQFRRIAAILTEDRQLAAGR